METSGASVDGPNTLRYHFEASHCWDCERIPTNSPWCFWLAGSDFRSTLTSRRWSASSTDHAFCSVSFSFRLCRFDHSKFGVNVKYDVFISMSEVYCGIPPIQTIQIDRAEVKRWTLSVCCLTYLDECVILSIESVYFLSTVHRTLKAFERFTADFPVVSFRFACLLALVGSATTAATFS